MLHLHPAKQAEFLDKLIRKREEKENKNFQKNFKNFLPVKKRSCTFAPALKDTRCVLNKTRKQEEHVPRHIELTAVLKEISKQNNKE
jgi:hypothetical protein